MLFEYRRRNEEEEKMKFTRNYTVRTVTPCIQ